MKSTLIMVVVVVLFTISAVVMAGENFDDGASLPTNIIVFKGDGTTQVMNIGKQPKVASWKPSGYVALSVSSKSISSCTSYMYYDKYVLLDAWLDLPAGFAVEVDEYKGLQNSDFDNDGVDEFDAYIWKSVTLPENYYLKFRLAYFTCAEVSEIDGDDLLCYDVFLGRSFIPEQCSNVFGDLPITMKTEIRVQYCHSIDSLSEGMVSVMPGVSIECPMSSHTIAYERLGLQWNDEQAPFGKLLSGQLDFGIKTQISKNWSWNVLDVLVVRPLEDVDAGDPRSPNGAVAFTTGLTRTF